MSSFRIPQLVAAVALLSAVALHSHYEQLFSIGALTSAGQKGMRTIFSSAADDDEGEIPCNLLGRSSFHFRERPTSAQVLPRFNGGRTGNLFFTLGASIVHVLDQNATPLLVPSPESRRYNYLPVIVNSSMYQSDVTIEAPSLGYPYYQTRHYNIKFHQYRDELCHYMAMKPFEYDSTPGDQDVVIYVRDIPHESTLGEFNGVRRIYAPPPRVFYDRILQKNHYEKVWVVGDPEIMNLGHPIVGYLMEKYNATKPKGSNALEDFQFISLAKNIILSPSTFGWWAAYFSSYRTTLHFPIMPLETMLPWCELLPGRPRVKYYDWFRSLEFDDIVQAREVCDGYLEGTLGDVNDESLLSFY